MTHHFPLYFILKLWSFQALLEPEYRDMAVEDCVIMVVVDRKDFRRVLNNMLDRVDKDDTSFHRRSDLVVD